MLSDYGARDDSWESSGQQDQPVKSVNPKGNQPWIFFERTDADASVLWLSDVKSQLIQKDPGAGKDWGQEEEATEVEVVGWHQQLNGHEFQQTLGDTAVHGVQRVRHNLMTEQYMHIWVQKVVLFSVFLWLKL